MKQIQISALEWFAAERFLNDQLRLSWDLWCWALLLYFCIWQTVETNDS